MIQHLTLLHFNTLHCLCFRIQLHTRLLALYGQCLAISMNSNVHVWSETALCVCHSDSVCVTFTHLIVPSMSFSKTFA